MADEAVNQVIADYYRDFSTLKIEAILPYFNEPSLLVGPQGVIPIPNHAALAAVFGPVMEGLRAKGYGRSEFELDYAKSLSSSAALIGGVAVRYNADGLQLERVGVTYLLHKTVGGWNPSGLRPVLLPSAGSCALKLGNNLRILTAFL